MADLSIERNPRFQKQGVPDIVKMNQLQNLLHDALVATDNVQSCAIVRRRDASLRASSVGFNLYPDQIHVLLDAFKNPPQTREEGIYFSDKQYKCVRADKNSIYAKHTRRGLVLVRTTTLLLVATYSDNMHPSVCVEAVEKLEKKEYFYEGNLSQSAPLVTWIDFRQNVAYLEMVEGRDLFYTPADYFKEKGK